MATLDELKERVQRMLNTITENNQFDESKDIGLIVDGIASAHDAILPWVPKLKTADIPAGTTVFDLPEDLFEIEAVMDAGNNRIMSKLLLQPGGFSSEDYWLPFPTGSITFNEETSIALTLYYTAYWEKPTEEDDLSGELDPPDYCMTPMALYATAYVILPDSVQSAEIRQWNVRSDSGHPEHNPLEESVKFLLALFNQEMNALPKHQRARK
jgi:hypothetical protein